VVGKRQRGETSGTVGQYVETLIQEIRATPLQIGPKNSPQPPQPLKTVFFGGGTPSLLSVPQLAAILREIDQRFGIAANAEISIEMDPATFELDHLLGYQAAGVNRVSLGVQAFQDEILAASGRFHRRSDIFQAVKLLRQAKIDNFSLDLISGLPHQTLAQWQDSLREAIALNPTHLSLYDLIVEPQTAFSRYFTPGQAPLPSDETTVQMYRLAQQTLTASGYDHYEICNYAKAGYRAQHNLTYWHNLPCYGFGMGATSYLYHHSADDSADDLEGYQRIDRPRTQRGYRQWVEQFIQQQGRTDDLILPPSERVLEGIMVGLRLQQGISLAEVYQVYGEAGLRQMERAIAPHIQKQWLIVTSPDGLGLPGVPLDSAIAANSQICLSDPEGFLMSNIVIVDAFNALAALQPNSAED
jgi:putative oxygen-independent coproporphyrinogen III oxidase